MIDWDALPPRLRNNWHIYLTVRSESRIKYASAIANATSSTPTSGDWVEAFDAAFNDWLRANPPEPMWESGHWPAGADELLGRNAIDEARTLLAASMQARRESSPTRLRGAYPILSAAQFGAALERLYLLGVVRSRGWIPAAWRVLVQAEGPGLAVERAGFTSSGLTRPLHRMIDAVAAIDDADVRHYQTVLVDNVGVDNLIREVERRWKEIRKLRLEHSKEKLKLQQARRKIRRLRL